MQGGLMTPEELYALAEGSYEEAKARLMNDAMISRFVVRFLDDPSFSQLEQAWEAQDVEQIRFSSHTLKGVAGNLALTALQASSTEFHEMYRNAEPSDAAAAQAAYDRVCADYKRTASAIAKFRDQL